MKNAYVPGSFDPVTIGHYDIILRAAEIFPQVTVAVCVNSEKKSGLFGAEARKHLIEVLTEDLPNVTVEILPAGMTVAARANALDAVLVKGVRSAADLAYEAEMAEVNATRLGCETLFVPARAGHSLVSSSVVRELLRLGESLEGYIPEKLIPALKKAYAERGNS